MSLKLNPCSYKAAKYAVENWHYSHSMPTGKLVKYGAWEDDKFIGDVMFGRGANQYVAGHLNCDVTEACELVRVALKEHQTPVTRIVSIALKLLKKDNPGIKMVYSYSDITNQGHHGIIYRAGNWKYHGVRESKGGHFIVNGRLVHNRTLNSKYGSKDNYPENVEPAPVQRKHFFTYRLRD